MYQPNPEDEKSKLFPGGSNSEYNFNYNAEYDGGHSAGASGYYGQHQPAQQPTPQPIYSTGPMTGANLTGSQSAAGGFSASNAFDNIDISRNGNRFSSGTPFETVQEFVSVSNKVKLGETKFILMLFPFILQKFQNFLDSTTPHTGPRWLVFSFLLLIFVLRVVFYQGFYVVAYALGIYLLNIFLLFLSPKFDPALTEDESGLDNDAALQGDDDGGFLPGNTMGSPLIDEFRPFVRRLPEFKFWYSATTALLFSLCCTLFSAFDIPVFWPILLMYFVTLFALTMRRQIQHMVKYKYLPFDLGKKAYA